jgi:hypothetical protein
MPENRIASYFDPAFGETAAPAPLPQAFQHPRPACPHLVQRTDLYQAAHARAVFDHQLGKLFNPEAPVE